MEVFKEGKISNINKPAVTKQDFTLKLESVKRQNWRKQGTQSHYFKLP